MVDVLAATAVVLVAAVGGDRSRVVYKIIRKMEILTLLQMSLQEVFLLRGFFSAGMDLAASWR